MVKLFKILPLILGFLLFAMVSEARIVVQSGIDHEEELGVGEEFTWTISVLASEAVSIVSPQWPELKDFNRVNSWESEGGRSSRLVQTPQGMSFENFVQKDYHLSLKTKKQGVFSLPSLTLSINGQPYQTRPISVEVVEGGQGNVQQQIQGLLQRQGSLDEAEEVFEQLLRRQQGQRPEPSFRSAPKNLNEAFFVQVEVDKTNVYEGEQVNANWYIYTRGALEQIDRLKFPDLKGFWKEDIEPAPALTFTQEVINGVPFKKAMLASYALFAIKPGTVIIDEYKIKAVVRLPSTAFGLFGFGKPFTYTRSSERVKVNVNPLPTEGRPKTFSNAVGSFQVESVVEGQTLKAYQPMTYHLRIEGVGNAKMIDLPPIDWPSSVEVYDTKQTSQFFKNGRSFKQFDIVLIPKQAGALELPGIHFSYFDPNARKYVEKTTEPLHLTIEPGNPTQSQGESFQNSQPQPSESVKKGPELPPIIAEKSKNDHWLFLPLRYWLLIYLILILILLAKSYRNLRSRETRKDMKGLLKKRFKAVHEALHQKDYRKVGAQTMNAVYLTLGDLSGLGGASFELEKLLAHSPPSVRRDLGEPVQTSLRYFEVLAFAPEEMLAASTDSKDLRENVRRIENLLLRAIDLSEKEKANISF